MSHSKSENEKYLHVTFYIDIRDPMLLPLRQQSKKYELQTSTILVKNFNNKRGLSAIMKKIPIISA